MNTYKSASKRPIITTLCFISIIILGIASCTKSSSTPRPVPTTLMVITRYPGADAWAIEDLVTRPLESMLNSVEHLKHISSQSRENISLITLEFENGYNINDLTNDVRDKLNMAMNMAMLPDDVATPFIFKPGDSIIMLSVKAEESMPALFKILKDNIANPLARIKGVTNVSIIGAPKREINIYMDPYKMEAYNISIETVSAIIGAENRNIPGGSINIGNYTYPVRVEGEFESPEEMMNIVVGSFGGQNVYLRDVARIVDGTEERAQKVYTDGQQGAMIIIELQSGGNSAHITNAVREMLPELQKRLPSDIEISIFPSLLTSSSINREFLPSQDSGTVSATLELPIGTRVEKAEEIATELANKWKLRYGKDLKTYILSVGQANEENAFASLSSNKSHIINFYFKFTPETERSKSLGIICDEMRADIRMNPEIARSKVSMGRERKATFEIYGYDFDVTDQLAKELTQKLRECKDISEVNISRSDYQPQYNVDFNREKLAGHGIRLSSAAMSVRNCINGALATKFREDGDEYDVKVRYEHRSLISIENIILYSNNGIKVRVGDVGEVVQSELPPTIERKDRERVITVDAVMAAGAALSDGVAYGMSVVNEMTIPIGYKIQVTTSY
ncbi:MAG: efflux RND transporter permease subunit [Bacteroidaceae bacterium]|nr:efflux RND transporter permease subunit [Bacteroidaceae bacterium]